VLRALPDSPVDETGRARRGAHACARGEPAAEGLRPAYRRIALSSAYIARNSG